MDSDEEDEERPSILKFQVECISKNESEGEEKKKKKKKKKE